MELQIEAVRQFPTLLTQDELGDPRVVVEHVDGRLLVRQRGAQDARLSAGGYDLIIANLPYPSTLQLNRFYTAEFFQMASTIPSPDNRLKVRALFAMANEQLKLGNLRVFIMTMEEVDHSLDKFQRASLTSQEATLMALYDYTQGKPYRPGIHPEATRRLFEKVKGE